MPVTVATLVNTTSLTATLWFSPKLPTAAGDSIDVRLWTALSVKSATGTVRIEPGFTRVVTAKLPLASDARVCTRLKYGTLLTNRTAAFGTAAPSASSVRPFTWPASAGSGASALAPSAGTVKLATSARSSSSMPSSASGGSCTSRAAEATPAVRLLCWATKCIRITRPPGGTVTPFHW